METISLTILKASKGHKLVNREQQVIALEIQLAPSATADEWEEITETDADALQAEWDAAAEAEREAQAAPTE